MHSHSRPNRRRRFVFSREPVHKRRRRTAATTGALAVAVLVYVALRPAAPGRDISQKRGAVRHPILAEVTSKRLALWLPATPAEVVAVGYHEAAGPAALPLRPLGSCATGETTATVRKRLTHSTRWASFVMATRGRAQSRTSAADVALRKSAHVRSPVNGFVVKIRRYYLYGKYLDYEVEIQPDRCRQVRVCMTHLNALAVRVGQRVWARRTVIGVPRRLPIKSQIDDYLPRRYAHTHIQVNRRPAI